MGDHDEAGGWPDDEETDPDEWIVEDEGVEPAAVPDDEAGRADGGYTCGVCGETYDSAAELHRHLYRVGLVE